MYYILLIDVFIKTTFSDILRTSHFFACFLAVKGAWNNRITSIYFFKLYVLGEKRRFSAYYFRYVSMLIAENKC